MNIYKELRKLAVKMDADVSNAHQIKDLIRAMSVKLDGNSNGAAIADAVKNLTDVHSTEANLHGLKLDVEIAADEDLLGKYIGDLQYNLRVDGDTISGTSFMTEDYTGFSGETELQKGNFIAVHASVPGIDGVTIKVHVTNATTIADSVLDSDGILIFRITDPKTQKLTFTASKSGFSDVSRTYTLSSVICQKNPLESIVVDANISTIKEFDVGTVEDIQEDVTVSAETISNLATVSGNSKWISDGDLSGHYLVLHAATKSAADTTIKVGDEEVDSDGDILIKIDDKTKPVVFTVTKEDYKTVTKTISLSDLALEAAE